MFIFLALALVLLDFPLLLLLLLSLFLSYFSIYIYITLSSFFSLPPTHLVSSFCCFKASHRILATNDKLMLKAHLFYGQRLGRHMRSFWQPLIDILNQTPFPSITPAACLAQLFDTLLQAAQKKKRAPDNLFLLPHSLYCLLLTQSPPSPFHYLASLSHTHMPIYQSTHTHIRTRRAHNCAAC